MSNLENMELIHKFVENSLNNEELDLFNTRYREDPEFAELANSYLDMSIAIKAADQFSKTRLKHKKDNKRYISYYKWVASVAASLVLIAMFSLYTIHLNKKNGLLSIHNYELTSNNSKLKQEIAAATRNPIDTKPINATHEPTKVTGDNDDQRYFSTIMALNKIVETNANKNITRNSEDVGHVFPIQSKLMNTNGAYISILNQQLSKVKRFCLIELKNNDTIFRIESISGNMISLDKSGIQSGEKYYWIITYQNGNIESGSIFAVEKNKVKTFLFKTGNDYLEAFIYCYNNGYYFDAQSVLKKAKSKYINEELFSTLTRLLYNTKTL